MIIQLTVGPSRQGQKDALLTYLETQVKENKAYTVEIKQYYKPKTNPQLRYVWGVVYPMIIANSDKPKPEDKYLNFWLLGMCFGWIVTELNGAEIDKQPEKKLSELNTQEMSQYIAFIQRTMSETRGLYIPNPEHIDKNETDYE